MLGISARALLKVILSLYEKNCPGFSQANRGPWLKPGQFFSYKQPKLSQRARKILEKYFSSSSVIY